MKQEKKEDESIEVEAEEVSIEEVENTPKEKGINLFQRRKDLNTEFATLADSGTKLESLNAMKQIAFLWAQGLLPESIDTPEKAVIIYQYAQELGIPGILSTFDMIYIYKRKPTVNGAGLAFLIRKAGHGYSLIRDCETFYETRSPKDKHALGHMREEFIRRNEEGKIDPNGELCPLYSELVGGNIIGTTIAFWRKENPEKLEFYSFTNVDAKKAELDKLDTYKKYTSEMYYWKCLTHGAKRYFSEVIKGLNFVDEPNDLSNLQVSSSLNEVSE